MSLTFPDPCATVLFLPESIAQVEAIADAYETGNTDRAARPEAVRRLRETVTEAAAAFVTGTRVRKPYPATFQEMAREGEEWLLVHRYWFGYVRDDDQVVVFAVLDATSDMPSRR